MIIWEVDFGPYYTYLEEREKVEVNVERIDLD
jgi:hypothetical protein